MSHITCIKTKLVDKDALLKALGDFDNFIEINHPETVDLFIIGSDTKKHNVDFIAVTKLGGEIGFRKRSEYYEIIADWWKVLGVDKKSFTRQLNQRYAYHATISKLTEQGFSLIREEVTTEGKEKGKVRLLLRRLS